MDIGFVCDIRESESPRKVVGASRCMRAIPMASVLKEKNVQLLIYSLRHINPDTKMVSGYHIIDGKFVPVTRPVPKVNGCWYLGNCPCPKRSGLSLYTFIQWANNNNIEVYPDNEFGRLLTNKFKTYELLKQSPLDIHPHTELYDHTPEQINSFLEDGGKVFVKARSGSQGDKMIVLKLTGEKFLMSYYENKGKYDYNFDSVNDVINKIKETINDGAYIIQKGIDVECMDGNPFIIRVIMAHDGLKWHWSHKTVVSPKGDIANTEQEGVNYTVEHLFSTIFSKTEHKRRYEKLKTISFQLADYFDSLYPKRIIEFAIDFVATKSGGFSVVEADVTPGLIKPGMDVDYPFKDYFNISPEEQPLYDQYVEPHARYLAEFLLTKV